jgi:peptidylprolyl isomerase domain and WD repeat-containing protein 1
VLCIHELDVTGISRGFAVIVAFEMMLRRWYVALLVRISGAQVSVRSTSSAACRAVAVYCGLVVAFFLGNVIESCYRQPQPERFARLLNASPKLPATASVDNADTVSRADTLAQPTHVVRMETSKGAVVFELYGHDAPRTVDNFLLLVKRRFYDNLLFHRIAKNFVIQSGDPKTKDKRKKDEWGTGGESATGEPFADEINPDAPSVRRGYKRGTLCMANRGQNTNTSQFFVCVRDVPELPLQYTIFGAVIEGMNVVEAIAAEPIEPVLNEIDGRPVKPVVLRSLRLVKTLIPAKAQKKPRAVVASTKANAEQSAQSSKNVLSTAATRQTN